MEQTAVAVVGGNGGDCCDFDFGQGCGVEFAAVLVLRLLLSLWLCVSGWRVGAAKRVWMRPRDWLTVTGACRRAGG